MIHEQGIKAAERCLSPSEYRALGLRSRRWMHICLDAGETAEAQHQLTEAARFFRTADEIEQERRAA